MMTVDLTDDERMQIILALGCRMGIEVRSVEQELAQLGAVTSALKNAFGKHT